MFLSVSLQAISKTNNMIYDSGSAPYGVMGFDEDMKVTSCNNMMHNIVLGEDAHASCIHENVLDVLDRLHQNLSTGDSKVKVVIVVSEKCSQYIRNGYVSSAVFTTIVDDTGQVKGGTIVLRKK